MILEYLKACIYGIVEGVTEWLPISSTGHLILFERALKFDLGNGTEFSEQYLAMFDVVIQLGAILAVVFLYAGRLFAFSQKRKTTLSLWLRLMLATLPAALVGIATDGLCEMIFKKSLDSLIFTPQVVASALIVYGILFILTERLTASSCWRALTAYLL